MVGEEDSNNQINSFIDQILDGNKKYNKETFGRETMPTYFHAGETNNRHSVNLHDSILLGTKRIGHGFQLQVYPHL